MSEQGSYFYEIKEWDSNYESAYSFFKEKWISPKWMITIEETKENVLSIVAYHTWEKQEELITNLKITFEKKQEQGFLLPLFKAIWKALDTIFQTKNSNDGFNLEKILQENNYKLLNLETKNAYTYTWKDEEWWYIYIGENKEWWYVYRNLNPKVNIDYNWVDLTPTKTFNSFNPPININWKELKYIKN